MYKSPEARIWHAMQQHWSADFRDAQIGSADRKQTARCAWNSLFRSPRFKSGSAAGVATKTRTTAPRLPQSAPASVAEEPATLPDAVAAFHHLFDRTAE